MTSQEVFVFATKRRDRARKMAFEGFALACIDVLSMHGRFLNDSNVCWQRSVWDTRMVMTLTFIA